MFLLEYVWHHLRCLGKRLGTQLWQQPSKIILILSVLQVNNLKIFSFKHTLCNVFALFDCHGPVVHFLATDTFNISPTIPSGFGSNVTNALFLKNCRIGCLHDDHHHYKNRGRFTYWNITFYSAPKYLWQMPVQFVICLWFQQSNSLWFDSSTFLRFKAIKSIFQTMHFHWYQNAGDDGGIFFWQLQLVFF